jgi:hypothetical protein
MTRVVRHLSPFQENWANRAIRSKAHSIEMLMRLIKLFMIVEPDCVADGGGVVHLELGGMRRIFVETKRKAYSMHCPFRAISGEAGEVDFVTFDGVPLDSKLTSEIISLLSSGLMERRQSVAEFADPVLDVESFVPGAWMVLLDLLLWEDGYLRADHDPKNSNGHVHPLNHCDVFYTQGGSFKVGIREEPSLKFLAGLLDRDLPCLYFNPA